MSVVENTGLVDMGTIPLYLEKICIPRPIRPRIPKVKIPSDICNFPISICHIYATGMNKL